ncbi:MAG: hypothetical protein BroJett003_02930 [Planctomycetota bacterium]|nr:MAG: hypothetical protein BroJett003_02930 [Planctomycetota bacterium]
MISCKPSSICPALAADARSAPSPSAYAHMLRLITFLLLNAPNLLLRRTGVRRLPLNDYGAARRFPSWRPG